MNQLIEIEFNGKVKSGNAQIIQGKLWVHLDGEIYVTESNRTIRKVKDSGPKIAPNKVLAPMPGKITRVFIQKGQAVSSGQALIVMEAMKMEYTLKCELNTSVEDVLVKLGDQVQLGQILVKLNDNKTNSISS